MVPEAGEVKSKVPALVGAFLLSRHMAEGRGLNMAEGRSCHMAEGRGLGRRKGLNPPSVMDPLLLNPFVGVEA